MYRGFIILVALVLSSCKAQHYVASFEHKSHTEVREVTTHSQRDTIIFASLPREMDILVTPLVVEVDSLGKAPLLRIKDTISIVETSYSRSVAEIKGGVLIHTIEAKDTTLIVEAKINDTKTCVDSIIIDNTSQVVENEINRLYWWQSSLIWIGVVSLLLLGFWVYRKIKL